MKKNYINKLQKNWPALLHWLGFIIIFVIPILILNQQIKRPIPKNDYQPDIIKVKISGTSMSGILENNDIVEVDKNYFQENKMKTGDIILFNSGARKIPIIKKIYAIAGDKFMVKQNINGLWNIYINDKLATNSNNVTFQLGEAQARIIKLYEKDYDGIIPTDSALVMGNIIFGTIDSSRFGLIHKNDIIGKVIK